MAGYHVDRGIMVVLLVVVLVIMVTRILGPEAKQQACLSDILSRSSAAPPLTANVYAARIAMRSLHG
jgi:hypothetical protein